MPRSASWAWTAVVAVIAFFVQRHSAFGGYLLSLLTLLSIVIASWTDSFWPSRSKREKVPAFALFWGLLLGLLVPYAWTKYLG